MNIDLLKHVGHPEQLCGIRESKLIHGPGEGVAVAEFHNAAGLRFTVVPDRCMDLYDLSYRGVNLSFLSRNGLRSPLSYTALNGEFAQQWSGGMLSTCGLDNVGGACADGGTIYPTHGRISAVPAQHFGVQARWEDDDYVLEASGEMHQTRLYGAHLSLERTIRTTLNAKSVTVRDRISNLDAKEEPLMLLYHCNFGYPLLDQGAQVLVSAARAEPLNDLSTDPARMISPVDGRGEELYLCHASGGRCVAMLYNPALELAGYVAFDTAALPRFLEWKMMKSHDYVLALEPCNTWAIPRDRAVREEKAVMLPGYGCVETGLEIGVVDGADEIRRFIDAHRLSEPTV